MDYGAENVKLELLNLTIHIHGVKTVQINQIIQTIQNQIQQHVLMNVLKATVPSK